MCDVRQRRRAVPVSSAETTPCVLKDVVIVTRQATTVTPTTATVIESVRLVTAPVTSNGHRPVSYQHKQYIIVPLLPDIPRCRVSCNFIVAPMYNNVYTFYGV